MRSVPWWGLVSSASAPVLLIGGWALAARLQDGHFDQVTDSISALAADGARYRWVMTVALTAVGVAHVTTALALRPAAPVGRWLIAAGGIATAAVAANPLPAENGSSPRHTVAAGIAFVTLGAWPAFSWRRRHAETNEDGQPAAFQPAVAIGVAGVLITAMGWFFAELFTDGDQIGLSERVAAGSQALWPLIAVLSARRQDHPFTS